MRSVVSLTINLTSLLRTNDKACHYHLNILAEVSSSLKNKVHTSGEAYYYGEVPFLYQKEIAQDPSFYA